MFGRRYIYFIFFVFISTKPVLAERILLVCDSSIKGAVLETNRIYKRAVSTVAVELVNNGFDVIQSGNIPLHYIPKRARPPMADWKLAFKQKMVPAEILMIFSVTRRIERSPINQSQIGFKVRIFSKGNVVKPLAFITDMPPERRWAVSPQCSGPCLTGDFAKKVVVPARNLGLKIVKILKF